MPASPSRQLARIVLFATGLAILLVGLVPLLVIDDLPDPLASRWSFDGEVTSTMSATSLLALVVAIAAPTAVALVAVALTRREARTGSRTMWTGAIAMLGATIAGAAAMTVSANNGRPSWERVPGPAAWEIVVLVVASIAVGVLASWAASGLPEAPRESVSTAPLDVPDTAVVAWSRSLTVRWAVAFAAVMAATGLGVALLVDQAWVGIVVFLSALPSALLSRIDVFADRRGLTVTYGPWGWPRTHIPLGRIESAAPIDLVPSEWGGWGYRGSIKLFRQAAVVLRAGRGLRLELTDGRRFAVSIDDPETAAAVLTRERLHS